MQRFGRAILVVVLGALALVTAVSLAAPWSGLADAATHLRLHIAAAGLILAASAVVTNRRMAVAGVLIAAFNVAATLPLAENRTSAPSSGSPPLKIMTLNVRHNAANDDQIAAEIAAERPDVVLLQEVRHSRHALLTRLAPAYPHQISCAAAAPAGFAEGADGGWACDVAILSRLPWVAAHAQPVGPAFTKMAWVRFGRAHGDLLVASVHLRWPGFSDQAAQLAGVRDVIADHAGPVLVAGDFNAVPWSAALRTFSRQADLRPAGGVTPTWPRRTSGTGDACLVCVPHLQLDHVLVGPGLRVRALRAGSDVGSDHLPLIAELDLPLQIATGAVALTSRSGH